ncbi:MAG: cupin domain-containing protein [Acidimicrobiia bacterium]
MTTQNRTVEAAAPAATVVDREAAEALPALPLEGFEGVTYKLLWRSGKSVAGIMHVRPGREVGAHVHQRSHHHIWVLEGSAEMVGRRVGPGSYVHVPAGVEHGITGVEGHDGLTVYYLYLRDPDGAAPGAAGQPG